MFILEWSWRLHEGARSRGLSVSRCSQRERRVPCPQYNATPITPMRAESQERGCMQSSISGTSEMLVFTCHDSLFLSFFLFLSLSSSTLSTLSLSLESLSFSLSLSLFLWLSFLECFKTEMHGPGERRGRGGKGDRRCCFQSQVSEAHRPSSTRRLQFALVKIDFAQNQPRPKAGDVCKCVSA